MGRWWEEEFMLVGRYLFGRRVLEGSQNWFSGSIKKEVGNGLDTLFWDDP